MISDLSDEIAILNAEVEVMEDILMARKERLEHLEQKLVAAFEEQRSA